MRFPDAQELLKDVDDDVLLTLIRKGQTALALATAIVNRHYWRLDDEVRREAKRRGIL